MQNRGRLRRLLRGAFAASASLALVLALVPLPGCSNQGEGDRCNRKAENNGNDDCQDGLVCVAGNELGLGQNDGDRCCPPPGQPVHASVCAPGHGGIDASLPPDAATEASTDAGSDAADANTADVTDADTADVADANDDGG